MIPLKYNTASQEIPLGYFVDDTDGKTAETGLTIANTDIKLWKAGTTTLANKNSGGATHISGGIYYCTLDATDTNTYGPLIIFIDVAGALSVRVECLVMEADAYDALMAAAGTGHIEADTVQIEGSDATDQINAAVDAAFTTQMADSVPADGTIATREQAIYMILQFLSERDVSGTTLTVKKVDGSTTLLTYTLDDSANPTSITRAS